MAAGKRPRATPSLAPLPNRADVSLGDDGIINVVGHGHITAAVVESAAAQLRPLAQSLRAQHRPVYVLIDVSNITSQDSAARLAFKHNADIDVDRSAAYGASLAIGLIMQYLMKSTTPTHSRYFRTRAQALAWLLDGEMRPARKLNGLPAGLAVLTAIILVIAVSAVYVGWRSAQAEKAQEAQAALEKEVDASVASLNQRLQLYSQVLYGLRGLYASSVSVERNEFRTYVETLDLAKQFPGFTTIGYAKRVKSADKGGFMSSVRKDTSLVSGGYPDFRIFPGSFRDDYYPFTYVEPTNDSMLGFDLASDPARLETLMAARDSSRATASTSIQLVGDHQGRGFLIALPLYQTTVPATTEQRRSQLSGFVIATFEYDKFFAEVLQDSRSSSVAVAVLDTKDNILYSSASSSAAATVQETSRTLAVGGREFKLVFKAPATFGLSAALANLPLLVLVGGSLATLLVLGVVGVLMRSRGQALQLADAITEDLQAERNAAVASRAQLEQAETALKKEKASIEQQVIARTYELGEAHAQLVASVGGLPFGFAVLDRANRIMFANSALAKLLNRQIPADPDAAKEVLEDTAKDLRPSADLIAWLKEAQASKLPVEKVVSVDTRYLRFFVAPIVSSPAGSGHSQVTGTILLIEDVTEERATQRSHDEFFSVASHELRTPLTAIRGNLSLILELYSAKLKDAGLRQMVTDAHEASVRLMAIVNDFLDVSRLEEGTLEFKSEAINLVTVGQQVIREYEAMAKEQKLVLKLNAPQAQCVAVGDANRVHQILSNLISNSLRFTEKGGITVTVGGDASAMRITVTDTGKGIPAEFQHLLFRKFQQASSDILTRDASRSTGLGLFISNLLAQGMGGKLELERSEPGKGSTFVLELPPA
jgi:CHASE1-domain containing sensor protein/nitrogen-specific signal transduction histidine kinase